MIKKFVKNYLDKRGLEIRRKYNGFSLNNDLSWLKNSDIQTVLDVGANYGQFAIFARSLFPNAAIFSFEPLNSCYKEVVKIAEYDSNLQAFNCALGEADAEIEIYHDDFSPSSSFLKMSNEHVKNFPFTGKQKREIVNVRRLDGMNQVSMVGKEVLLKIDVQGYELNVLKGASNFIKQFLPIIILEVSFADLYENEPTFDDLAEYMKTLGYSFSGSLDQMYSPIDGKILQADAIFEYKNRT